MAEGDVFKVTLHLTLDAVECRPGFYVIEGAGGGAGNSRQVLADHVVATLGADPLNGFVQNLNLTGVQVDDIQPGTGATWLNPLVGIAGDIIDDNPPPPQDTMLATFKTAKKSTLGNYAAQGRMYMPGIYSTGQISGFITATLKEAFDDFLELIGDVYVLDGTAYQMHVVSFTPGSNPRTIRAFEPVTEIVSSNRVRSQRRRQAGVGI